MKYTLIALSFLVSTQVQALDIESEEMVHAAAHFGVSYAITHGTTVTCKKLFNGSKTTCSIAGAAIALSAGAAKEYLDHKKGAKANNHMRSMLQNTAGVGAALFFIHIDF